ncbi:hypothetical protein EWI07_03845 [Sporolactobacillus sp. THM7-4]|nr:hypothetical protein EWI07_03845 [Sporolactobacillus sp. THM7-4]
MHKIHTKIGEHLFKIEADSANLMNMFVKHFSCLKTVPQEPVDMTLHIRGGYGTPIITSDFSIAQKKSKQIFRQDDRLIDMNLENRSANLYVYNGYSLKKAFINLYSSFIVSRGWGLLIHAGCVVENEMAYILPGDIGNRLAAGMNDLPEADPDEGILVKIADQGAVVFPSPFGKSLGSTFIEDPSPVDSIHFLRQSFEKKRTRLGRTQGLLRLLDMVFYSPNSMEQTKRIIDLLKQLVYAIPIYDCCYKKNEPVSELIS